MTKAAIQRVQEYLAARAANQEFRGQIHALHDADEREAALLVGDLMAIIAAYHGGTAERVDELETALFELRMHSFPPVGGGSSDLRRRYYEACAVTDEVMSRSHNAARAYFDPNQKASKIPRKADPLSEELKEAIRDYRSADRRDLNAAMERIESLFARPVA